MIETHPREQFAPIVLGKVEDLTAGDGTGFSDSGSGHKAEGGSIDSAPYTELPPLKLDI